MKKINSKQLGLLLFVAALLLTQVSLGQASAGELGNALGFSETVDDVPEAPISMFIGMTALIGSYLGFRKLKA
ncbi:hypothetical protein [Psychroflexus planctonicus]|uniref:PEP-CTERM protein-sorting domain-containing protein n=1 Tax=Psychroflexus planctonicus TaxID=1526575 RepID=A0ABQ1SEW5_9FLAO|nr:hypothetical protein [Psychroflexus planctonicus]GGE25016.1 hypothetical protein GCM10010832_02190 [Psychroflexus planctonicus]